MEIVPLLARLGAACLSVVLPAHCPGCDAIVHDPGALCGDCFARAGFVGEAGCRTCASPLASVGETDAEGRCAACAETPPPWDAARAAFVYDAFARDLILPLKYADRTENARVLGLHMARAAGSLLAEADLLVPVPLHRWRLASRRYNQAALLAAAVRRHAGAGAPPVLPDALVRRRATRRLAHQSARTRNLELEGAIAVRRPDRIAGRRIVLVDDVLTTGSTARASTLALREAGAASVGLLVAARTLRTGGILPSGRRDQT